MLFWRVLLELGKHCVSSVPHWPGGKVWVLSPLLGGGGIVRSLEVSQMVHRHSMMVQNILP